VQAGKSGESEALTGVRAEGGKSARVMAGNSWKDLADEPGLSFVTKRQRYI